MSWDGYVQMGLAAAGFGFPVECLLYTRKLPASGAAWIVRDAPVPAELAVLTCHGRDPVLAGPDRECSR